MAPTQTYIVHVSHPTNFHSGEKRLTVHTSSDPGLHCKFVTGSEFGCSRDYPCVSFAGGKMKPMKEKAAAEYAIKLFMAEHACTIVEIRTAK